MKFKVGDLAVLQKYNNSPTVVVIKYKYSRDMYHVMTPDGFYSTTADGKQMRKLRRLEKLYRGVDGEI